MNLRMTVTRVTRRLAKLVSTSNASHSRVYRHRKPGGKKAENLTLDLQD